MARPRTGTEKEVTVPKEPWGLAESLGKLATTRAAWEPAYEAISLLTNPELRQLAKRAEKSGEDITPEEWAWIARGSEKEPGPWAFPATLGLGIGASQALRFGPSGGLPGALGGLAAYYGGVLGAGLIDPRTMGEVLGAPSSPLTDLAAMGALGAAGSATQRALTPLAARIPQSLALARVQQIRRAALPTIGELTAGVLPRRLGPLTGLMGATRTSLTRRSAEEAGRLQQILAARRTPAVAEATATPQPMVRKPGGPMTIEEIEEALTRPGQPPQVEAEPISTPQPQQPVQVAQQVATAPSGMPPVKWTPGTATEGPMWEPLPGTTLTEEQTGKVWAEWKRQTEDWLMQHPDILEGVLDRAKRHPEAGAPPRVEAPPPVAEPPASGSVSKRLSRRQKEELVWEAYMKDPDLRESITRLEREAQKTMRTPAEPSKLGLRHLGEEAGEVVPPARESPEISIYRQKGKIAPDAIGMKSVVEPSSFDRVGATSVKDAVAKMRQIGTELEASQPGAQKYLRVLTKPGQRIEASKQFKNFQKRFRKKGIEVYVNPASDPATGEISFIFSKPRPQAAKQSFELPSTQFEKYRSPSARMEAPPPSAEEALIPAPVRTENMPPLQYAMYLDSEHARLTGIARAMQREGVSVDDPRYQQVVQSLNSLVEQANKLRSKMTKRTARKTPKEKRSMKKGKKPPKKPPEEPGPSPARPSPPPVKPGGLPMYEGPAPAKPWRRETK